MKEKAKMVGYYRGKSEIPFMMIRDAKFKVNGSSCLADEIRVLKAYRPTSKQISEV